MSQPVPPPSGEDAPEHGPGAASLAGIRIRPSRLTEQTEQARKRGDITLMLSRVAAKPQLAAPTPSARPATSRVETAAVAATAPALRDASGGAPVDASAPPAGANDPIDATVRERSEPPLPPGAVIDAEIVEPAGPAEPKGRGPADAGDAAHGNEPADRRHYDPAGRRVNDIQGYWARLRDGRRWPAWADMDAGMVAQVWPNSYLLTCEAGGEGGRGAPVVAQATRIGRDRPATSAAELPITPAVIDWIRSVGAEVAASGLPARHTEQFAMASGSTLLRLQAVPLSDAGDRVDRVLCQVAKTVG